MKRPGQALSGVARSIHGHSTVTQRPLASPSYTHTRASEQCKLIPAKDDEAGKVTLGQAESNVSLLLGLSPVGCLDSQTKGQHRPHHP